MLLLQFNPRYKLSSRQRNTMCIQHTYKHTNLLSTVLPVLRHSGAITVVTLVTNVEQMVVLSVNVFIHKVNVFLETKKKTIEGLWLLSQRTTRTSLIPLALSVKFSKNKIRMKMVGLGILLLGTTYFADLITMRFLMECIFHPSEK